MDEQIYLRPYVELLVRSWKWILAGALLAGLVAFVLTYFSPRIYEAETAIAIARSRTDVTFDSRIRTLSEDELTSIGGDVNARRDALVALVTSADIAVRVLDEIGQDLGADDRSVGSLLNMIKASSQGDLILIGVQHGDPGIAALIANTWASGYVQHVNDIYADAPESISDSATEQIVAARNTYDEAQAELEKFIKDNRVGLIQKEIDSQQALLSAYLTARNGAQSRPVNLQVDTAIQRLTDSYADLQNIDHWLADALALRDQVGADSASAAADLGNLVALVGLRGRVYGGAGPVQLQLDMSSGQSESFEVRLGDVDALIEVLEGRREITLSQIDTFSESLLSDEPDEMALGSDHPLNVRIVELNVGIQALRAELESQEAQRMELLQARDLAWETYQSLVRKQAEELIASQATGTEVRLAASAVTPETPVSRGLVRNTIMAAALGFGFVVFGLVVLKWWREEQINNDSIEMDRGEAEA